MFRSPRRIAALLSAGALLAGGAASAGPALAGAAVPAAAAVAPDGARSDGGSPVASAGRRPPVGRGQRVVVVTVPGGLQAAVYDQHGNVWFWKVAAAGTTWTRIGSTTYPRLPHASGAQIFRASGALLTGMHNAVFIFEGVFTGDGDADYIAFGTGPHGWGRLAPRGGRLIPTGARSTDNTTPGLALHIQASHGLLEVSAGPDLLSVAQWGLLPVNRFYRWGGTFFTVARDNIVDAVPAPAPLPDSAGVKALPDCPSRLPDGVYDAGGIARSNNPRRPFGIDNSVSITLRLFDANLHVCPFTVPGSFAMSMPMTTTAGRTRWVTAPAWLLSTSGSLGNIWGDVQDAPVATLADFRPRGRAPYFVSPALHVKAFAMTAVESPVANFVVQIAVHHGVLTSIRVFWNSGQLD